MGTPSSVNKKKQRGSVLVLVCVALIGLIAMAAIAIDLGLMYSAKGQLQNASDAAALAGASRLNGTDSSVTFKDDKGKATTAIQQAIETAVDFAKANRVIGANVILSNSDIEVGVWQPLTASFTAASTGNINAVKVTANRTQATNNPVGTLFAKIFNVTNSDIKASSIAVRNVSKGFPPMMPFLLSIQVPLNTQNDYLFNDNSLGSSPVKVGPDYLNVGWTVFSSDPSTNANDIRELLWNPITSSNAQTFCSKSCFQTTNGTQELKSPLLDIYNAVKDKSTGEWQVMAPLVDKQYNDINNCLANNNTGTINDCGVDDGCNTGVSPSNKYFHVAGWAIATIRGIDTTGSKGLQNVSIDQKIMCDNPNDIQGWITKTDPKLVK